MIIECKFEKFKKLFKYAVYKYIHLNKHNFIFSFNLYIPIYY